MRDQHKRKDVWHRKMRYGKKLCAAGLSICLLLTGCSGLPFGKDKSRDVYTPPKSTDVECTQEPEVIGMSDEDATYASLEYLNLMVTRRRSDSFSMSIWSFQTRRRDSITNIKAYKSNERNTGAVSSRWSYIVFQKYLEPEADQKLIRKLQKNSSTPLFVCVDEEGGDVARIGNNPKMKTDTFPSMEEIGKTEDADYVYYMAETIGSQIGNLALMSILLLQQTLRRPR